jgi:hypothetical protein
MKHSEEINEIALALAKAQGDFANPHKNKTNPFLKSKYADLSAVWEACREPLSKQGLSVVQLPEVHDGFVRVVSMLLHASGQFIETELSMKPAKFDVQGIGATITYIRRYQLQSMLGLAADEEDDGESAVERPTQKKTQAKKHTSTPKQKTVKEDQAEIDAKLEKAYAAIEGLWEEHGINTFEQKASVKKNLHIESGNLRECRDIDRLRGYYKSHKEQYEADTKKKETPETNEQDDLEFVRQRLGETGAKKLKKALLDNDADEYKLIMHDAKEAE